MRQDYFYKGRIRINTLLKDIRQWKTDFHLQRNGVLKGEMSKEITWSLPAYFTCCLFHLLSLALSFHIFKLPPTSLHVCHSTLHGQTFPSTSIIRKTLDLGQTHDLYIVSIQVQNSLQSEVAVIVLQMGYWLLDK